MIESINLLYLTLNCAYTRKLLVYHVESIYVHRTLMVRLPQVENHYTKPSYKEAFGDSNSNCLANSGRVYAAALILQAVSVSVPRVWM